MNNMTSMLVRLHRRSTNEAKDPCNPGPEGDETYQLTLRIVSVFVLLVVSILGAVLAVLSSQVKCCRIPPIVINTGKFFGTGVILATGFIHMLPVAMEALTDSCLPADWLAYEAYAGLFAMLAILFMQLIEFIAHHQMHRIKDGGNPSGNEVVTIQSNEGSVSLPHGHSHGLSLLDEKHNHRVSTYLLEFGVAIHSVLIGLALGTEEGATFVALFIALCFHQLFEAFALGAQIAKLDNKSIIPAILMIALFSITTPIGIAIGIGIRSNNYNPKSLAALITTGVLDSVSGGILIYVALVNLMAGEMGPTAHEFFALKIPVKVLYFVALYLGAALMAIIGRWA